MDNLNTAKKFIVFTVIFLAVVFFTSGWVLNLVLSNIG